MFVMVKRLLALTFLSVFIISNLLFAADDWQIIKVSGHDYLSVDNISKFYGLAAEVVPVRGKTQLETVNSPLEVRAHIADAARHSIFVSIHFNATNDDPNATGFEIFSFTPLGAPSTSDGAVAPSSLSTQPGTAVDAQSVALSACIYHSMLGHIPEFDRGIKRARFAVLRLTRVPAVLVEGGFLTERGESQLIAKKDWRVKLAQAIGAGVENYVALGVKKQPPMLVADYRRENKSPPVEFVAPEADSSLLDLLGDSVALSPSPTPAETPLPVPQQQPPQMPASLESAVIVP